MKKVCAALILITIMLVGCSAAVHTRYTADQYRVTSEGEGGYNFVFDTPFLIETVEDFEKFLEEHPPHSTEVSSLKQNYNSQYFEENVVYAYVKLLYSGSVNVTSQEPTLNSGVLTLYIDLEVPENFTDDEAYWVCLFGVDKVSASKVSTIEVEIED